MPRNTANKSHLSAFCSPALVLALDAFAVRHTLSRSQAIRSLLTDALERHQQAAAELELDELILCATCGQTFDPVPYVEHVPGCQDPLTGHRP